MYLKSYKNIYKKFVGNRIIIKVQSKVKLKSKLKTGRKKNSFVIVIKFGWKL